MIELILIFFLCILAHELGHYITAKVLRASPRFYFKNFALMMHSEPNSRFKGDLITISGVLSGFLVLFLFIPYLSPLSFLILFILLIVGSNIDFLFLYKKIRHIY